MRASIVLMYLVGAFAALVPVYASTAGSVESLTSKTFDALVGKEDFVLVKFFAPWCGHCQSMVDDFEKAASTLKGKAVLADVDATIEEGLAEKYNVDGFPTLKLFAHGEELVEYKGQRDADSMIRFVEGASKPAFEEVTSVSTFEEIVDGNKHLAFVVGCGLDEAQKHQLNKASFVLRDVFPGMHGFLSASTPELVAKYGKLNAGEFALISFRGDGVEFAKYVPSAGEDLIKFLKMSSRLPLGEFTESNADLYSDFTFPVVIGFFKNGHAKKNKKLNILRAVAEKKKKTRGVAFAWANSEKLAGFAEHIGLKDTAVPIGAFSFNKDEKYVFPADVTFTGESFEAWVDDLVAGKIEKVFKSEPVPETQPESGPAVVVGDSWASVVEDSEKDVLIAQVAPWCGHCKAMKPVLGRVADELKAANVNNVVIATMDATQNDAPDDYKAQGFPTVHFFPAEEDSEGVSYEGGRSSKDIINFLKKNAAKKFDFDTSKLGPDPVPEAEEEEEEEELEEVKEDL